MRTLYPIFLVTLLICGACSYLLPAKKVECCENKAACCFEQACCLPRYAKAAGVEPKPFTTDVPVYGTARDEDLQPAQGEVVVKPTWLSRLNPFSSTEDQKPKVQTPSEPAKQDESGRQAPSQDAATEEKKEEKGLWPF